MASAFYILDFKGSPLVYRSFRGDITQDVSAVFHRRVLDEDCCVVPVFEEQGYTYAFIRVNDVYLVMVSKIKISPLLQIAFMRRCVGVFESYFKRVTEKTVQDNFVIIYELIDEMCDFGFPQYTEVKILKEYITQTGFFDTLLSSDTLNAHDLPAAVTASGSATAWREPGRYLYARNEIFLDVIESINMLISPDGAVLSSEILGVLDMRTRLSGMPTVQVGLNDRILYYINSLRGPTVDMEDIKFHQCVRLNEFESDRVISFIPPDGRFELMTYRCNRKLNPPVAVTCRIRQHGNSRVDMRITVNTNYQSTVFANYVDVMVPIPNDADNPKARCTLGQVSYIPETSMLMWGLGALGNRKSGVCHAQYHLPSVRSTDARVVSTEPIQVRFKIPYFAVSGFAVRYVRVTEASNYHVQPWVRYITQNVAMQSALRSGVIESTRRVREPLNFLSMQSIDKSQISTSIRTMDALIMTFYLPLTNLQQGLHRRYEAEQFAQILLPPGVLAPQPVTRWPTQDSKRGVAAGTSGFSRFIMSAPHSTQPDGATNNNNNNNSSSSSTATSEPGSHGDGASGPSHAAPESRSTGADPLHNELHNRVLPSGETCVPLGLVTLMVGTVYPQRQSWLEHCVDPGPHPTLSLRVAVLDRIHWQRTCWMTGCICRSLCWGRIPHRLFAIEMDFQSHVVIDGGAEDADGRGVQLSGCSSTCAWQRWWRKAERTGAPIVFDEAAQRYVNGGLRVSVPEHNFHITVQDTGATLFDEDARVVDGFADNESALHRLALAREVNMLGLGGSVYRQPSWSTPCLPNLGTVTSCEYGSLFTKYYGCNPVGTAPVAAWMIRSVPETLIYQMEGEVEDENDPNSATTYGDRSLTERVQKKAMNRYNNFRDEIRSNVYSELGGQEMPR